MACEEFGFYEGCPNCKHTKLLMQFYHDLWSKVATMQTKCTIKAHDTTPRLEVPEDVQMAIQVCLLDKPKFECFQCEANIETMEWYKYFSTINGVPKIEEDIKDAQFITNGPQ